MFKNSFSDNRWLLIIFLLVAYSVLLTAYNVWNNVWTENCAAPTQEQSDDISEVEPLQITKVEPWVEILVEPTNILELKPWKPVTSIWHFDTPPTPEDYQCMVLNIYFESQNQSLQGQYAVADVVMYRLEHYNYPNTICGVIQDARYYDWNPNLIIKHKCQFSWFCDGKSDEPIYEQAFMRAEMIAKEVISDPNYIPVIEHALFYHGDYVTPNWASSRKFIKQIDNHLFYN